MAAKNLLLNHVMLINCCLACVAHYLWLTMHCSLFVACHAMLIGTCHSVIIVHCSLELAFIDHCSLLIIRCLVFIADHLLHIASCALLIACQALIISLVNVLLIVCGFTHALLLIACCCHFDALCPPYVMPCWQSLGGNWVQSGCLI